MGCDSRPRARAKPLAGRYSTHSKFKRAKIWQEVECLYRIATPVEPNQNSYSPTVKSCGHWIIVRSFSRSKESADVVRP